MKLLSSILLTLLIVGDHVKTALGSCAGALGAGVGTVGDFGSVDGAGDVNYIDSITNLVLTTSNATCKVDSCTYKYSETSGICSSLSSTSGVTPATFGLIKFTATDVVPI